MSLDPPTTCILTFVTAEGRRCYFATELHAEDQVEACRRFEVPEHVQTQLDALRARLAWRYLATPRALAVRGPAATATRPVTEVKPAELGRLTFE